MGSKQLVACKTGPSPSSYSQEMNVSTCVNYSIATKLNRAQPLTDLVQKTETSDSQLWMPAEGWDFDCKRCKGKAKPFLNRLACDLWSPYPLSNICLWTHKWIK